MTLGTTGKQMLLMRAEMVARHAERSEASCRIGEQIPRCARTDNVEHFRLVVMTVDGDEGGQATIEYLLLAVAVALPIGMMLPVFLRMMVLYFYRFAAMVALPVP